MIMVMHGLTVVLDASKWLGQLVGHAARVCDLVRAMAAASGAPTRAARYASAAAGGGASPGAFFPLLAGHRAPCADAFDPAASQLSNPRCHGTSNEMHALRAEVDSITSEFGATLPEELRSEVATLLVPMTAHLASDATMDVSAHSVGDGRFRDVMGGVFTEMPSQGPVIAVCTFQQMSPTANRHRQARANDAVPCLFAHCRLCCLAVSASALHACGGLCHDRTNCRADC